MSEFTVKPVWRSPDMQYIESLPKHLQILPVLFKVKGECVYFGEIDLNTELDGFVAFGSGDLYVPSKVEGWLSVLDFE